MTRAVDDALPRPAMQAAPMHPDAGLSRSIRAPRTWSVAVAALVLVAGLTWLAQRQHALLPLQASTAPTRPALEAALTSGDLSSSTLVALARERARAGEHSAAVEMLTTALQREPRQEAALQAMVDVHDQARRPLEAVAALEQWLRVAPDAERQRQLVRRYAELGDERQLIRALGTLIVGMRAGTPDEQLRLAGLLLSTGAPQGALDALAALVRAHPTAHSADVVALQLKAALALAEDGAAASSTSTTSAATSSKGTKPKPLDPATDPWTLARAWMATPQAPAKLDVALAPLLTAGQHDGIAALLEPKLESRDDAVVSVWAEAMRRAGRHDVALRRLAALAGATGQGQTGNGSQAVLRERVITALQVGRLDAATQAVRSAGWDRVPASQLAALSQALLGTGTAVGGERKLERASPRHEATLRELWTSGAQKTLAASDPVLAARIALAVSDHAAAAQLTDAASTACEGKPDCAVRLAQLNLAQGRSKEAAAALKQLDESPLDIDEALLVDYARTSMTSGSARDALVRLERQRRPSASAAYASAWALLAVADGRHGDVQHWLETAGAQQPIDDEVAKSLFKSAVDAKAHGLVVAVAQHARPQSFTPAQRVMLAQALLEQGKWPQAQAVWKDVRSTTRDYDDAYAKALEGAIQRGVGSSVQAEYATMLHARLQQARPGKDRDMLVQQLVDLGAHDKALPWLESLAATDPARWLAAFETAASTTGQGSRVLPVLRKVSTLQALPSAQRVRIGWQLMDAGDKAAGDHALRLALVDTRPDDPAMVRLMNTWGPRFTPDQLDWVEARAQTVDLRGKVSANDAATLRGLWMQRLNDVGGAARTVSVYRRLQPGPQQGPEFDAYVEALTRLGDRAALAQALRREGSAAR